MKGDKMKRITIILGALSCLAMFLIYCTTIEFDNPVDSKNSPQFLQAKLCAVTTGWPHTIKFNDGSTKSYWGCEDPQLRIDALLEDDPGVANIMNPKHDFNHVFNENTDPTTVEITRDLTVRIKEKLDFLEYEKWTHLTNWPQIYVIVTPNQELYNFNQNVVTVTHEDGRPLGTIAPGSTPLVGTYHITYTASRTLRDGVTTHMNFATRTLIIEPPPNDDFDPPVITMGRPDLNPQAVTVDDEFIDYGATAHTVRHSTSVPVTTTFTPTLDALVNNGTLRREGDKIFANNHATATSSFTITYSARHPVNNLVSNLTRTVTVVAKQIISLPAPVIVLPTFKFNSGHFGIPTGFESVDTIFNMGQTFREPGNGAPLTGVTAYYVSGTQTIPIPNSSITITPQSTNDPGHKRFSYNIARVEGVHEMTSVTRNVYVVDTECDLPLGPTSSITGPNPLTIARGVVWSVSTGWSVQGRDDGGLPFRLVDYNGLNHQDPQPREGGYNLKLMAIGGCGVPSTSGMLTRTIIVQ